MRADRLIAALLLLQTRSKITAAELAEELEVSERTARRDLEALAMSGVPIYSQPGRGGGWRLIGGARTDLTGLSSEEARALFLALSRQEQADPVLEAALRKLVVALPEHFRTEAVSAVNAIKVDPAGWGQVNARDKPEYVDPLARAVVAGRQVRLRYQGRDSDEVTERTVHPLGLVTKRGIWYLVAHTDRGRRTYRVERVHDVEMLDAPVERPDDFDLDEEWGRIVTEVEARRVGIETRALVEPSVITAVRWIFGTRFTEHAVHDDRRIEVTVGEGSAAALAAQLAGFGGRIALIEPPPALVTEMRRIADELAAAWVQ